MPHNQNTPEGPSGIGATAMGVAFLRAQENQRPDRLFDDPYAQHLMDAVESATAPWETAASSTGQSFMRLMAEQVAVRTRFLDDTLLEAAGSGCGQIVLLACGMDARAFRLPWPTGTMVFELDFADVLSFRDTVLTRHGATARCSRIEVATDLREDWPRALIRAGFDPDLPTAWLAEGLLYALPAEAADVLLDRITAASAPGSILALDHIEDSELLRSTRASISPELLKLWQGGPTADLDTWLSGQGWRPAVHHVADIAARYQRPVPPAFDPADELAGHGWLATARIHA